MDRNTHPQQTFWMKYFLDPAAVISSTTGVALLAAGNINEPRYLNVFLHPETCAVFEEGGEAEVKGNFWWRRNPRRNPGKSGNCVTNLACADCGPMVVSRSLFVKMNAKCYHILCRLNFQTVQVLRLAHRLVRVTPGWPSFDPVGPLHWLPVLEFWKYLRSPSKCFGFDRFDFLMILLRICPSSWEDERTICEESDEISIYLDDFESSHIRDVYCSDHPSTPAFSQQIWHFPLLKKWVADKGAKSNLCKVCTGTSWARLTTDQVGHACLHVTRRI